MIRKIIKKILILFLFILIFFTFWFALEFSSLPKTPSKKIFFEVKNGDRAQDIARNLKREEIIRKEWTFLLGYKIFFSKKTLKAGEYAFETPSSQKNILSLITEGRVYLHSITIPEGLTREEIANHLRILPSFDPEKFLTASSDAKAVYSFDRTARDLEGYLFPETYYFPRGIHEKTIVSAMVSQFKNVFNDEWEKRADEIGMTVREVVILASLIEKETSLPQEKKLVSAVFHNRLNIGMKLDCDPTIIYVLKQEGSFKDRLYTKDLKLESPYNTYLYSGLPPGPISNPGRASIEAALYPAEEEYLYFVSRNNGSHKFSRTFEEHQLAVAKYQKQKK